MILDENKKYQHLLYIAFDSPEIFRRNLYFEFEGVKFKLIKGTKEHQELLCSIIDVPHYSHPKFEEEIRRVSDIALKFLSCLSWEHHISITSTLGYGKGWNKKYGGLTGLKRVFKIPRKFPPNLIMGPIQVLPKIDNKLQAIALGLYREAKNANSPYYKFLCYWKILELPYVKGHKVTKWIDKTINNNKWILEREHFDKNILKNKTMGDYLYENCRHAIAHVMPKHRINPDCTKDLFRINISNQIMEELIRIFIEKELKITLRINNKYNYLSLVKIKGKSIPVFVYPESYEKMILGRKNEK